MVPDAGDLLPKLRAEERDWHFQGTKKGKQTSPIWFNRIAEGRPNVWLRLRC